MRRRSIRPPSLKKKAATASRKARKASRKKERFAQNFGAEYGDWLRAQYRVLGCPLCGNRRRRCELHHDTRLSQQGSAEHLVFTCWKCHRKGHGNGFGEMEAAAGVSLAELAALYAGHGYKLGLLPVESCAACGDWHSSRYMATAIDGKSTRRLCEPCGGSYLP